MQRNLYPWRTVDGRREGEFEKGKASDEIPGASITLEEILEYFSFFLTDDSVQARPRTIPWHLFEFIKNL